MMHSKDYKNFVIWSELLVLSHGSYLSQDLSSSVNLIPGAMQCLSSYLRNVTATMQW